VKANAFVNQIEVGVPRKMRYDRRMWSDF
jgi:hypothetical protein